jgi:hypothetical protein
MAEPLSNRINPAQPNFEIKHRDELEEAAKSSRALSQSKLEDDVRKQTERTTQRREEIRTAAETDKQAVTKEETLRKGQETIDKRRPQEKTNPEAGNIINVVA